MRTKRTGGNFEPFRAAIDHCEGVQLVELLAVVIYSVESLCNYDGGAGKLAMVLSDIHFEPRRGFHFPREPFFHPRLSSR